MAKTFSRAVGALPEQRARPGPPVNIAKQAGALIASKREASAGFTEGGRFKSNRQEAAKGTEVSSAFAESARSGYFAFSRICLITWKFGSSFGVGVCSLY